MALKEKKAEAIRLRLLGESYSRIKDVLGVSKGTLSIWLEGMPLSKTRIDELRGKSPQRIERFRETMSRKRLKRLELIRFQIKETFGRLTEREILLCGVFLYWGEGSKTKRGHLCVSNTDPAMILFFIEWLSLMKIERDALRIYLHLYEDMDIEKECTYWSIALNIPRTQFRKPYIKKSLRAGLTYTQRFAHGTCNAYVENTELFNKAIQGIEVLREQFAPHLEL